MHEPQFAWMSCYSTLRLHLNPLQAAKLNTDIWFHICGKGTNVLGIWGKIWEILIVATWMSLYSDRQKSCPFLRGVTKKNWEKMYKTFARHCSAFGKLYTFEKVRFSSRSVLWRHSCGSNQDFPYMPSTLVPFSQIQNHITEYDKYTCTMTLTHVWLGLQPRAICVYFIVYIVACQRGGVSVKPPWLQAATRHGPLTL